MAMMWQGATSGLTQKSGLRYMPTSVWPWPGAPKSTYLYRTENWLMSGMMKSALLFYRKLVADLTSFGYEINPYDPCVANKIINGKQMTIC
jgi:hypothetical protein